MFKYLQTFLSQNKRHEGEVIVWYVLKIQLKLKNFRQISFEFGKLPTSKSVLYGWHGYDGKISAQPHTIVKQICFPNGNVLFLSLWYNFRTAPCYCKTNLLSQWQCIAFVIVFFIQELNA